ncbi:MAG: GNAT family N-acetyltransferase, partial [Ktedonobacterales bacterium]|nr:GNAT family N-acetyltransferase [Ktedonobacterales bacterium]
GGTVWRITDPAGTLIGVAETALVPPPQGAWVALLVIDRAHQRQGYGTAAADLLEAHLFAQPGITRIGMGVLTHNTPALAFWEGRGYTRGLHRRDQHGHDIFTLRRDKAPDDAQVARVRQQFGATAAGYATSVGHARGDELARVAALVAETPPGGRALDVATGAGHTAFAIAPHVAEVVASDVTPEMLLQVEAGTFSRRIDNLTTTVADVHALPFADASFTIVTSRIAPHHFSALPLAVREMTRVLQPGGLLIIVDSVVPEAADLDAFLNHVERLRDPSHVRSLTETEWRQLFEDNHLTILAAERYPHRHPYTDWVERALVPKEEQPALEAAFLAGSAAAQAAFQIEIADGRVVAYTDEKLLIAGRKS